MTAARSARFASVRTAMRAARALLPGLARRAGLAFALMGVAVGPVAGVPGTALAAARAPAADYDRLRADARVERELLAASIAYLLAENCPDIRLRRLRMAARALSLRAHAIGLGYRGAQVDAYVNDKAEQARFRALAMGWLRARGLEEAEAQSWCRIAREEIARNSWLGQMMALK